MVRDSEVYASDPLLKVWQRQVFDPNRGSFFVRPEATTERHHKMVVHKDALGRRFVILDG